MNLPIVKSWAEWGPLMSDRGVWEGALHQVSEKAGLRFGDVEPGFPGTCAVFEIKPGGKDPSYFVKIFPPMARGDFSKEVSILEFLQNRPLTPKLLAQGTLRGETDFPYLITQALPGHAIRDCRPLLPEGEGLKIASRLGLAVRDLHALGLKDFKALPKDENTWNRFIKERKEECLPELAEGGVLSPSLLDEIHSFIGQADPQPSRLPPRLIHGDLTEDHVYLEESKGSWKLCGLLDFADGEIGDPYYEWHALWFGALERKPAHFQAFLRSYEPRLQVNRIFRERALAFSLLHRFGPRGILAALGSGGPSTQGWGLEEFLEWAWPETLETPSP